MSQEKTPTPGQQSAWPPEVVHLWEQVCTQILEQLGATSCSLSEWDRVGDAVTTRITYARQPELEPPAHIEAAESYVLADYPSTARVLLERVPVSIRLDAAEAEPEECAFLQEMGQQANLMLPLIADDEAIGLLEIYQRDRPRTFSAEEIALAERLAQQTALIVKGADLFRRARRQSRDLDLLLQANAAITASLDLETVLRTASEWLTRIFDLAGCTIYGWDRHGQTLATWIEHRSGTTQFWPAGQPGPVLELADYPLRTQVLQERSAALVHADDPQGDPCERARLESSGGQSLLLLPAVAYDRGIALIELQEDRQRRGFTRQDLEVAQNLANQAAVAIENARLFREREERLAELAILNEISRALSAPLEFDAFLETVQQQIGRVFDTTNFYVAIYEEGSEEWLMALQLEHGERLPAERHPLDVGVTGHIIRTRRPVMLHNRAESIAFDQERGIPPLGDQALSWMGVPMIVADKVVGVMAIQSYEQENRYSEQDLALFSTIAGLVASALDNLRLLEETRRRAQEQEVINEVGQAITSVLDLDTLLHQVVDITRMRFGHYYVCIAMVEGEQLVFRAGSTIGGSESRLDLRQIGAHLQESTSLVAEAARTGRPVLVNDVLRDPRYLPVEELADTRAELDVPIWFQDRVIGVLDVQSDRVNAYDEADVAVLEALTSQAGVAIENARLFSQVQRQVQELQQAGETQARLWEQVQEMSTPAIPVHDRILVLPLIGVIDSERARRFAERLLQTVKRRRTRVVLVDITGVPVVDTAVAQALLQTAEATRLLGAEVVLVGVRSEVAQTMVALGLGFSDLVTKANLQAGIEYALGRLGLRIGSSAGGKGPPAGSQHLPPR